MRAAQIAPVVRPIFHQWLTESLRKSHYHAGAGKRRQLQSIIFADSFGLGPLEFWLSRRRSGAISIAGAEFLNTRQFLDILSRIAARLGHRFDSKIPVLLGKWDKRYMVEAVRPPASPKIWLRFRPIEMYEK